MSDKTYSQDDVRKAWDEKVGKKNQYDLVEIETVDGETQTQLLDVDTGSITVAVNGTGEKALKKLFEHAGDTFIDGAEPPVEAVSAKSVKRYTSKGVLATPTQPEALEGEKEPTEVNPKEDTGRKTREQLAQTPEDKVKEGQLSDPASVEADDEVKAGDNLSGKEAQKSKSTQRREAAQKPAKKEQ